MQNTPSRNARGVLRVATKENKNEKRQFKNTAERYKKQHRLATNKTVLTYMNTNIYRTILLYRRKTFCATVLKGLAGCFEKFENAERIFANAEINYRNAEEDLETQKGAERGLLVQKRVNLYRQRCALFSVWLKSGLVLCGWIIARVKCKGAKWGLWCVVWHIVKSGKHKKTPDCFGGIC